MSCPNCENLYRSLAGIRDAAAKEVNQLRDELRREQQKNEQLREQLEATRVRIELLELVTAPRRACA